MSYFLAIRVPKSATRPEGLKAINRWLYPTKAEAQEAARNREVVILDADHDPGRTVMNRVGF